MVVYIREGRFLEETSMNKFNAQVGYHLRGEEVRLFKENSEIDRLYKEDILIDYIYETRWFLEKMGIEVSELDYFMGGGFERESWGKLYTIRKIGAFS